VNEELKTEWNQWLKSLMTASEEAFATVAYFRFQYPNGKIETALVGAKSKVAPTKTLSIPRLELQGALIGARFASTIIKAHTFKIESKFFWTDAIVVLSWLKNDVRKFHQFVEVRKGEILEISTQREWMHVPTKQNVADIATKIKSDEENKCWVYGPGFFKGIRRILASSERRTWLSHNRRSLLYKGPE
jgi:hypothetical protein